MTRLEDGRGHFVTVDEPTEDGGTNTGTSALELLVLSLSGCISTIFHIIADKRKLEFDGFSATLNAERDDHAPTIQRVRGTVEVRTRASREEVDTALRLTLKTCPIGVLFAQAHIPVDVVVQVTPSPGSSLSPASGTTAPSSTQTF